MPPTVAPVLLVAIASPVRRITVYVPSGTSATNVLPAAGSTKSFSAGSLPPRSRHWLAAIGVAKPKPVDAL